MKRWFLIASILVLCHLPSRLFASSLIATQAALNDEDAPASKYPVVLQHGLFGFRTLLFLDYFHDIPAYLRERGYQVFVTQVHPVGSVAERAEELSTQIDEILETTGAEKVNIIGHSMGGLDARYLVSKLGYQDKVASVSMIATPNQGSYIADFALSTLLDADLFRKNLLAWVGVNELDDPDLVQRAIKAIYNCSQYFIQNHFNPSVPDAEGVFYQSWGGHSTITGIGSGDRLNPLFLLTYPILRIKEGRNDGMVTVESSKWGLYHGYVAADHLDQIGLFRMSMIPIFHHRQFYAKLAAGLAARGF